MNKIDLTKTRHDLDELKVTDEGSASAIYMIAKKLSATLNEVAGYDRHLDTEPRAHLEEFLQGTVDFFEDTIGYYRGEDE